MFEVLDAMQLDMANFTIKSMRPYIKENSVPYEKKKFEDFITKQEGIYTLYYVDTHGLVIDVAG